VFPAFPRLEYFFLLPLLFLFLRRAGVREILLVCRPFFCALVIFHRDAESATFTFGEASLPRRAAFCSVRKGDASVSHAAFGAAVLVMLSRLSGKMKGSPCGMTLPNSGLCFSVFMLLLGAVVFDLLTKAFPRLSCVACALRMSGARVLIVPCPHQG